MTDNELKEIREKISCPQFNDDHYGEWGILNLHQRRTIKRMVDYIDAQEQYINRLQAENGELTAFANQLHEQRDMWTEKCDGIQDENKRLFFENQKLLSIVLWGNKKHKKDCLKQIKAEAYKEFADKVKEETLTTDKFGDIVLVQDIDNLLKELVGE